MKDNRIWYLAYFVFMGAATTPITRSIANWGKVAPAREAAMIIAGGMCMAAGLFIFHRYKLGGKVNPKITNPQVRNFLAKYPVATGLFAAVIGISAGVMLMLTLGVK